MNNNLQLIISALILIAISVWQSIYGFEEISRIKESKHLKITFKHIIYEKYLKVYNLATTIVIIMIIYYFFH